MNEHQSIWLQMTDMHTAGEPVRIVTGGYPKLEGRTILEKRQQALNEYDYLRKAMMLEPRGHSEMYGVIPVEPSSPEADLAVLFMHGSGYSTMCGHATIAIGRMALEAGLVKITEPETKFVLECPSGLVLVSTAVQDGIIGETSFENVPGYVHARDLEIEVPGLGTIKIDIGYGGAYYAIIEAEQLKLEFDKTPIDAFKKAAVAITNMIRENHKIENPSHADLGFLYGTIITENNRLNANQTNRHLCFFADGQLDRSPTGSGVTARLSLAYDKGQTDRDIWYNFSGASGLSFRGKIQEIRDVLGETSVITHISGRAFHCGTSDFIIEKDDPLRTGLSL